MNCPYCQRGVVIDYAGGHPAHHKDGRKLVPCTVRIKKWEFAIRPALDYARKMDIGMNPDPAALYDGRSGCVNFWCTPGDNPGDRWKEVEMFKGAHCKPSAYVGAVSWELDEHRNVVRLLIDSTAYDLAENFRGEFTELRRHRLPKRHPGVESIYNRRQELTWVRAKTRILFKAAGINLKAAGIPIIVDKEEQKK